MSDPTIIAGLLQSTLLGTTESIKKTQQTLEELQIDQNFLPNLLLIIKSQNFAREVRKAAAVYTKKYVKSRLIEKDQNKINRTAQMLLNILSETTIELPLRRYVGASLQYLLMNDQKFILREKLNPLCIKLMEEAKTADESTVNYQFLGFFAQTLMTSFIHLTKQLNQFMVSTFPCFCQLSLRIFKFVGEMLQTGDKAKIMHIFRILKLYSYTLKIYLRRLMLAETQTLKLLYDENLTLLISSSLHLTLQNNEINTTLIYFNPKADQQIVDIYHSIKSDYVQGLVFILRSIFIQFKDKQMIEANPILNNPGLIPSLINSVNQLFNKASYFQIKSQSLVKLIEEILQALIYSVRNSFFFQQFLEYKQLVVHGCVLKVLQLSQIDCDLFYESPDQFINQLLQIIEMNAEDYLRKKDKQAIFSQTADEIQEYSTLRTLAATLLEGLCKHIDGSLSQILLFSLPVLRNQVQSQFPKYLLLLMLSILRGQIIDRDDDIQQIIPIICEMLKTKPIPLKIKDADNTPHSVYEANIEYLVILLSVFRYLNIVPEVGQEQLAVLYEVVYNILVREADFSQALQLQAFDLVCSLSERKAAFELKFVEVLNNMLIANKPNKQKCLETLATLFSSPGQQLQNNLSAVVLTVQNMCKTVYEELQKKTNVNQLMVNKCWNVINEVYQSQKFIPKLIPEVESAILPLLPFIDGQNNYDFEEDIFMMMSSFIEKSKNVTQNQLTMFEIIPKLFYTQYEHRFGHSFETLHIFMLYGKNILATSPQAIKVIIEMAVCSMNTIKFKDCDRNQSENCEGVMILQSLILSCNTALTTSMWVEMGKALTKRLESPPVKTHILNSNILACLALILASGYKSFTNDDCDILLSRILQNYYCFVVQYSTKVAIAALSQLLTMFNLPFIMNRFTLLLEVTITILDSQSKQLFSKNPITQQERDYDISLQTIKNAVVELDQIEHFKKKIQFIKQNNKPLLESAIAQLTEPKQLFLNKIYKSKTVNNESRVIFKIKK